MRVVTRVGGGVRLWEKAMCWKVCSWEDSPTPVRAEDAVELSGKLDDGSTSCSDSAHDQLTEAGKSSVACKETKSGASYLQPFLVWIPG